MSKILPLNIEPSGVYFRPDTAIGHFFTGRSPEEEDEPSCDNLDVDYTFFDEQIWPEIAHRVSAMGNIKVANLAE